MDKTFQKLLRLGINLAPVGIERSEDNTPYFCTPEGASIFGWSGVDGIHFCFIRGFGEMVFSVSPMNISPEYVHPLAKNFTDFLRLLLSCGDVAALEQAWQWDEMQFEDFLRANPPTKEQKQVLAEISRMFRISAMERPWQYIKDLQSVFDPGKIKYKEDYYDIDMNPSAKPSPPEWKVYFDGNFWGHHGKDHAGTEITLGRQFDWADRHWVIPTAYACSKGLVLDLCMRVDTEEIRSFMKKWNLSPENDFCENFSREQQMKMEFENPLCFHFSPTLTLNGKTLRSSHGCSVCFNPCLPDGITYELEAKWAIDHYGLDTSFGWVVCRSAFPWETKRRPQIKSLSITMQQLSNRLPGPHFKVQKSGDTFTFLHPVSGTEYALTVQELKRQTIQSKAFRSDRWLYPTHTVFMSYTISPEPAEKMTVCDCADSDQPVEIVSRENQRNHPVSKIDAAVIGGTDRPTAIIFGSNGQGQEKSCIAYSSLHFEPAENVEWRVDFMVKQFEDEMFAL